MKTNMLKAGIEKEYRDLILGHSLKGIDAHYLAVDEKSLKQAMDRYTEWVDKKLQAVSANVTKTVTKNIDN